MFVELFIYIISTKIFTLGSVYIISTKIFTLGSVLSLHLIGNIGIVNASNSFWKINIQE